ncbi:hypothetical protein COOONC_17887 [Cooperia oncophora]
MPYTGKSLDYIKETVMKSEFAPHTAIQIACQTHLALKNLHELGYIHRDVKPDNFVVGRSETTFIQLLLTTRVDTKKIGGDYYLKVENEFIFLSLYAT